ncbi:MAG: DUF4276 family protein [Paludibacteraceae bacterium]|nr:DUF4276 family protein [Paludibacteraceae bacterium]
MKRLYIVVEGATEEGFVKTMLQPYFASCGVYAVYPILIHTSKLGRGGFVSYNHLENTVRPLLKSQGDDVIVTTFVDFFRIPTNMPQYAQCMCAQSNKERIVELERCLGEDINDRRFVPYIQLHEFEALLFSSNDGFKMYFTDEQAERTSMIVEDFDNPEDINSSPEMAPSKRILKIKDNYNKPLEGNLIALEIGINKILERCPRFASWVNDLIDRCK